MRRLSALDYWSIAAWAFFGLLLTFVMFGPSPSSWFRPDPEAAARSTPVRSTKMLVPLERGECQQTSFDSMTAGIMDSREVPCRQQAGPTLDGGSTFGSIRKAFRRD
jgi:hypothetical protein